MLNKFLCFLSVSFLLITMIHAEDDNAVLPGAFLRLPVNARANGMGSAFTASSFDASASWWNPAGLSYLSKFQLIGMYSVMSLDRQHNFVSIAIPSDESSTFALHWQQFGVNNIDGRDHFGNPTSLFDDNEMAFGLSYAFRLGGGFALGLTGKYLQHIIHESKANGYSMDAGLLINIKKKFMLGLVMQNIIGQLAWDTESKLKETLPKYYRAGIAIRPLDQLMLTFDATSFDFKNSTEAKLNYGAELWIIKNVLAIRAGLANKNWTAGASVGIKTESLNFRLDFAYFNDVLESGVTKQFSFVIGF